MIFLVSEFFRFFSKTANFAVELVNFLFEGLIYQLFVEVCNQIMSYLKKLQKFIEKNKKSKNKYFWN